MGKTRGKRQKRMMTELQRQRPTGADERAPTDSQRTVPDLAGSPAAAHDPADEPTARHEKSEAATGASPAAQRTGDRPLQVKVLRQDAPDRPETRRWERFAVPRRPQLTVVQVLQLIQQAPVTTAGVTVAPVAWEWGCQEGLCGACAMVINGRARLACTTFVDAVVQSGRLLVLEPLRKFPVLRDLVVDRSRLATTLKEQQAWVDIDGLEPQRARFRTTAEHQAESHRLSLCMTCACCQDACPEYGEHSEFMGAAAINQLRWLATHSPDAPHKAGRVEAVMGAGGVAGCGKAQNCVEVCPAEIPLVDSIQVMSREATRRLFLSWILK